MGSADAVDWRVPVAVALACVFLTGIIGWFLSSTLGVMIIVIAATVVAVASPLGAVCAAILTLPWFFQPLLLGNQRIAMSELLLVAAVNATLLRCLWDLRARVGRTRVRRATWRAAQSGVVIAAGFLAVLSAVMALAPYDATHRAESLREWRWVFAEPLALVFLLAMLARDLAPRRLVAAALLAGASLAAIQGFADLVREGGVAVEGVTRISGPYPHPNALALMTTRCVALGLGWMIFEPGTRRWLAPATLISGLAVIATFSRGAYAGLAGAVLVATPGVSSRLRPAVVAAPFVVVLSAIIVARDRMLSLLEGGSGSLRLDLWRSAGAMIRDRPIRGYGPDQFLYAYLPRYVEPTAWQERFTSHAHNYLFDFWVRLGIIGFAFAMVAVIACLVAVVGVVRRPRSFEALRAAGIVALTAVLLHGLVDNAYFSHDLAMSGWLLAWLAFGPVVESAAEGAHKGARPGFGRRWIHRITPVR